MRSKRGGNMILLATVLCLLILMAVTSLSFLTSTDSTTSGNLVRELKATALAESIAVTAEARANTGPWSKRFWAPKPPPAATPPAPASAPARLVFSKSGAEFADAEGGIGKEDYDYVGVIKDTSSALHTYRIYIEVTWQGELYTFTWDKKYEESLMGAVNRDATLIDKRVEGTSGTTTDNSETDQLIDQIKAKAKTPVPNSIEDLNKGILGRLSSDSETYTSAKSVAAEPTDAAPALPAQPKGPPGGTGTFRRKPGR